MASVLLFIHENKQVLFLRADLNEFSQFVLTSGVTLAHGQHLLLGLVEIHDVLVDTVLKLVQVTLDRIPFFSCVSDTIQLCIICKLAEGTFDLCVWVMDEDIEKHCSQDKVLRDTYSGSNYAICLLPFSPFNPKHQIVNQSRAVSGT